MTKKKNNIVVRCTDCAVIVCVVHEAPHKKKNKGREDVFQKEFEKFSTGFCIASVHFK